MIITIMYKSLFFKFVIYLILIKNSICDDAATTISSTALPSSNDITELPIEDYKKSAQKTSKDTRDKNLVSFIVANLKEIFSDTDDLSLTNRILFDSDNDTSTKALKLTSTSPTEKNEENFETTIEDKLSYYYKNYSHLFNFKTKTTPTVAKYRNITVTKLYIHGKEKTHLLNSSKVILKNGKRENQAMNSIQASVFDKSIVEKGINTIKRSCIFCDNVAVAECYNPKNKLIPSTVCERDDDFCYSQHTPFGIVDRGCFNINHDMSTYVCSCHLCNFISISEMPFIFPSKNDWTKNVIEMSRTKRFRKSIFRDMSCLKCEVNSSSGGKAGEAADNANCLEGNIGTLPIQECAQNEICGVKSIRSEGYIWRGCLTKPLYNYWWVLCDTDLCNYDSLVTMYDEF